MQINYLCISYVLFVDIFAKSFDYSVSMNFLIAVFLPVSQFIPTPPFINFGEFYQPPCFLHPPCLLFWPKFATLIVYSARPFYLKLESNFRILLMCSTPCNISEILKFHCYFKKYILVYPGHYEVYCYQDFYYEDSY